MYVTENLPIPHPKHDCRNRALEHNVQHFSAISGASLPIGGIKSCGIEALSNLAPHLEQLHMLTLWGRLWSRSNDIGWDITDEGRWEVDPNILNTFIDAAAQGGMFARRAPGALLFY